MAWERLSARQIRSQDGSPPKYCTHEHYIGVPIHRQEHSAENR
jgi:hypothetical protein